MLKSQFPITMIYKQGHECCTLIWTRGIGHDNFPKQT